MEAQIEKEVRAAQIAYEESIAQLQNATTWTWRSKTWQSKSLTALYSNSVAEVLMILFIYDSVYLCDSTNKPICTNREGEWQNNKKHVFAPFCLLPFYTSLIL